MPSFFERAFFKAVKKRRFHHPTRLKITIRSFHRAYVHNHPKTDNSIESFSRENSPSMDLQRQTQHEETIVSEDMARLLMRKGFSSAPKCVIQLITSLTERACSITSSKS